MNQLLFSVYDSAARRFLEPFFADTVEVACRMFRQVCANQEHQFARFPEDYTLFHIGEFDAVTGHLVPLETPHSLGVAVMFRPHQAPKALEVVG